MALQSRTDRTLRIRTMQAGHRTLPVETRIPLDYFTSGDGLAGYADMRALCQANPLVNWAAYIGGSIFTLAEGRAGQAAVRLQSAAAERGADERRHRQFGGRRDRHAVLPQRVSRPGISPARIARLGQMAENHVVGAPCGIMDQIAITSGREGQLTHILCRPGEVQGEVAIPPGTGFVGINSHGAPFGRRAIPTATRASARSWARRSSTTFAPAPAARPLDYLTELSVGRVPRRSTRAKFPTRCSAPNFSRATRRTTIR